MIKSQSHHALRKMAGIGLYLYQQQFQDAIKEAQLEILLSEKEGTVEYFEDKEIE